MPIQVNLTLVPLGHRPPRPPLYERSLALASALCRWCYGAHGKRGDLLAVPQRPQGRSGRAQEDCWRCMYDTGRKAGGTRNGVHNPWPAA